MFFGSFLTLIVCWERLFFGPYDAGYEIVAVSWGKQINAHPHERYYYQAQVLISDYSSEGELEVSARVCIGSGSYTHSLGVIGLVQNRDQAIEEYGKIEWTSELVTFGGEDKVRSSLGRRELERHR